MYNRNKSLSRKDCTALYEAEGLARNHSDNFEEGSKMQRKWQTVAATLMTIQRIHCRIYSLNME